MAVRSASGARSAGQVRGSGTQTSNLASNDERAMRMDNQES